MNSFLGVWRVDLRLKPSRTFFILASLLHLAALAAVMQAGILLSLRFVLAGLLLLSFYFSWHQEKRRGGIVLREQGNRWWLEMPQRQGRAELRRCRVWRYLVLMDFLCRDESGAWRQRLVVLPDAVSAGVFRRLRVRLRHGPTRKEIAG